MLSSGLSKTCAGFAIWILSAVTGHTASCQNTGNFDRWLEGFRKEAAEAGITHDQAKTGLASLLPQLINRATPDGSIPAVDQIGGLLKGFDLGKLLG